MRDCGGKRPGLRPYDIGIDCEGLPDRSQLNLLQIGDGTELVLVVGTQNRLLATQRVENDTFFLDFSDDIPSAT